MAKHRVLVEEVVYYHLEVEADSEAEAKQIAEQMLQDGDEPNIWEVDNSGLQLSDPD